MTIVAEHSAQLWITGTLTYYEMTAFDLTRDQFSYPYIQGSVTIRTPDAAGLAKLDPRNKVRMSLQVNKSFLGDDPVPAQQSRTLRLYLVKYEVDHAAQTTRLLLSSAETLLDDYRLMAAMPVRFPMTNVRGIVNSVLGRIGRALITGPADSATVLETPEWTPGQSAWDYLTPILEASGRRLYVDEMDNFRLVPRIVAPVGNVDLVLGTSQITDATESLALVQDYYDACIIEYRWTNEFEEDERVRYDTAQAGPTIRRVEHVVYEDTRYPGPGAARQRVNRSLTKGRQVDVSFVQDYLADPGYSATIELAEGVETAGYITAITWKFPELEMSIATRDVVTVPRYAWIKAPVGLSWKEAPLQMSWIESPTLFETEA